VPEEKLLFKGHVVKQEYFVKATNAHSGAVAFYRVERVWGQHGTFRVVPEQEAGSRRKKLASRRRTGPPVEFEANVPTKVPVHVKFKADPDKKR
jgi:hypothetical protein